MVTYSTLLITGGSGFLGWNLTKYASKFYDVYFTYCQHPVKIEGCQEYHLNLQNSKEIDNALEEVEPDVIIHTAALANADTCEKRRSMAYAINAAATGYLAQCAKDLGCRFVYISTDLIFDGKKGNYTEDDIPKPVNYYGETKLLGERAVRENSTDYLIVRMALMYGNSGGASGSFVSWLRKSLEEKKPVALFTDQYRSPLFIGDGVRALIELIEKPVKNEIFHLAGSERVNRYEFGKKFVKIFDYNEKYLHPVKMQDIVAPAKRGNDYSLNNIKLQNLLSFQLSDVTIGLQKMKQINNFK